MNRIWLVTLVAAMVAMVQGQTLEPAPSPTTTVSPAPRAQRQVAGYPWIMRRIEGDSMWIQSSQFPRVSFEGRQKRSELIFDRGDSLFLILDKPVIDSVVKALTPLQHLGAEREKAKFAVREIIDEARMVQRRQREHAREQSNLRRQLDRLDEEQHEERRALERKIDQLSVEIGRLEVEGRRLGSQAEQLQRKVEAIERETEKMRDVLRVKIKSIFDSAITRELAKPVPRSEFKFAPETPKLSG